MIQQSSGHLYSLKGHSISIYKHKCIDLSLGIKFKVEKGNIRDKRKLRLFVFILA